MLGLLEAPEAIRNLFATADSTIDWGVWAEGVVEDPALLGWAYQFWNQTARDGATWAVSRLGEMGLDGELISTATQLYTEEYMTRFVARRTLSLCESDHRDLSILDPACGSGHFLIQALRILVLEYGCDPTELIQNCRLCGADIDPFAVELCRISLWLEVARFCAVHSQHVPLSIMENLQQSVVALDAPLGTLDRNSCSPVLSRRYGCVLTNPPYVGRRKLSLSLRSFLDCEYPAASTDLCSAFIIRCIEMLSDRGAIGLVTMDKWIRLKGYADFRNGGSKFGGIFKTLEISALVELGGRAFAPDVALHDGVGVSLLVAREGTPAPSHTFQYIDLSSLRGFEEKQMELCAQDTSTAKDALMIGQDAMKEGEIPLILAKQVGIPEAILRSPRRIREIAEVVVGLQTNDDRKFVRYQWCVPPHVSQWILHSKGGGYGRWYGLNRFILNLPDAEAHSIERGRGAFSCTPHFGRNGWTYSWFANGSIGLRQKEAGWSFGRAASTGFFCEDVRVVAFLNSRFGSLLVRRIGGKVQLPEGIVRQLPLPETLDPISPQLVACAVALKKTLVAQDPREASFDPTNLLLPCEFLRIEAILLVVESLIEAGVEESLTTSSTERAIVARVIGTPVGWFRLLASEPEVAGFWGDAPPEYRYIYEYPICSRVEPGGTFSNVDSIAKLIEEGGVVGGENLNTVKGLPTAGPLEQICREWSIHPIDAYLALVRPGRTGGALVARMEREFLKKRALCVALNRLQHRWRSGKPLPRIPTAGISLTFLADEIVQALGNDRAIMPASMTARELDTWTNKKFIEEHAKDFFGSPIVKALDVNTVTHIWDLPS